MTGWLGHRRVHHAVCASTNDLAMELARGGAAHGAVVTAGAQTAGRGRAGRAWSSPPETSVYLSIALRPSRPVAELPAITLAAGIGVCDAARAAGVAGARLKWPNDVLVGDRKLGGILTELSGPHLVIGIGVNVVDHDALPAIATSIAREGGGAVTVAGFLEGLLEHLEPWLDRFLAEGPTAILGAWEARADLARRVRIVTTGQVGTPTGLAPDGTLRVRLDDGGAEARVIAGDVVEIVEP